MSFRVFAGVFEFPREEEEDAALPSAASRLACSSCFKNPSSFFMEKTSFLVSCSLQVGQHFGPCGRQKP